MPSADAPHGFIEYHSSQWVFSGRESGYEVPEHPTRELRPAIGRIDTVLGEPAGSPNASGFRPVSGSELTQDRLAADGLQANDRSRELGASRLVAGPCGTPRGLEVGRTNWPARPWLAWRMAGATGRRSCHGHGPASSTKTSRPCSARGRIAPSIRRCKASASPCRGRCCSLPKDAPPRSRARESRLPRRGRALRTGIGRAR